MAKIWSFLQKQENILISLVLSVAVLGLFTFFDPSFTGMASADKCVFPNECVIKCEDRDNDGQISMKVANDAVEHVFKKLKVSDREEMKMAIKSLIGAKEYAISTGPCAGVVLIPSDEESEEFEDEEFEEVEESEEETNETDESSEEVSEELLQQVNQQIQAEDQE